MIFGTIFIFGISCSSKNTNKEKEKNVQQILPEMPTQVSTIKLKEKPFRQELVSNGIISARRLADLHFQSTDIISKIYVRNGEYVKKGQAIASIDDFALKNKMQQAKNDFESSKLELQSQLIGQGYSAKDTNNIPEKIMNLIRIKSGYNRAKNQYELSLHQLKNATLYAPFSGLVANLNSKVNTTPNNSTAFCNIIATDDMEVVFNILENEMNMLKIGSKVRIYPYSINNLSLDGRITEINPWVNKEGMVQVKASINYDKRIAEGMKVQVSIFTSSEKQLVVPKTAVVLRTAKQVIFVLQDGKAAWHYVTTTSENAKEYAITSKTLKEGDEIIVSGNINLAHESPVVVINNPTKE